MQTFHIRYRNTQGTLMRILNAASRRGLDIPAVQAEAGRARPSGHAVARSQSEAGRPALSRVVFDHGCHSRWSGRGASRRMVGAASARRSVTGGIPGSRGRISLRNRWASMTSLGKRHAHWGTRKAGSPFFVQRQVSRFQSCRSCKLQQLCKICRCFIDIRGSNFATLKL